MKETYQLAKKQIEGHLSRLHYSDDGTFTYCHLIMNIERNWRKVKGNVLCRKCLKEEVRRLEKEFLNWENVE
jgi:hypothetical protein